MYVAIFFAFALIADIAHAAATYEYRCNARFNRFRFGAARGPRVPVPEREETVEATKAVIPTTVTQFLAYKQAHSVSIQLKAHGDHEVRLWNEGGWLQYEIKDSGAVVATSRYPWGREQRCGLIWNSGQEPITEIVVNCWRVEFKPLER